MLHFVDGKQRVQEAWDPSGPPAQAQLSLAAIENRLGLGTAPIAEGLGLEVLTGVGSDLPPPPAMSPGPLPSCPPGLFSQASVFLPRKQVCGESGYSLVL